MNKHVYIAESGGLVKIGVSANPEKRISQFNTGNHSEVALLCKTEPCSNPEDVESIIHIELSHKRVKGEWFDVSPHVAFSVVSDVFSNVAIQPSGPSSPQSLNKFISICGDSVAIVDGMYNISAMKGAINKYRKESGLGSKQLGSFFLLESTKTEITRICIEGEKPLSLVKVAVKGRFGGTYICPRLFDLFISWASGISGLQEADLCPTINKVNQAGGQNV